VKIKLQLFQLPTPAERFKPECMGSGDLLRRVIQNCETRLFHAGDGRWTSEPGAAKVYENFSAAAADLNQLNLGACFYVLTFGEPEWDVRIPTQSAWTDPNEVKNPPKPRKSKNN
jgi:hypothetical protein